MKLHLPVCLIGIACIAPAMAQNGASVYHFKSNGTGLYGSFTSEPTFWSVNLSDTDWQGRDKQSQSFLIAEVCPDWHGDSDSTCLTLTGAIPSSAVSSGEKWVRVSIADAMAIPGMSAKLTVCRGGICNLAVPPRAIPVEIQALAVRFLESDTTGSTRTREHWPDGSVVTRTEAGSRSSVSAVVSLSIGGFSFPFTSPTLPTATISQNKNVSTAVTISKP